MSIPETELLEHVRAIIAPSSARAIFVSQLWRSTIYVLARINLVQQGFGKTSWAHGEDAVTAQSSPSLTLLAQSSPSFILAV